MHKKKVTQLLGSATVLDMRLEQVKPRNLVIFEDAHVNNHINGELSTRLFH